MLYFILIHYAGIKIETLNILLTYKSRNTRELIDNSSDKKIGKLQTPCKAMKISVHIDNKKDKHLMMSWEHSKLQ
jgi:hypothetical protein